MKQLIPMWFPIKSYFQFLWHSKNEHAVHSPFVFNLIAKCFYDKQYKPEYELLEKYRNSLLASKEVIKVTDFGAGSKVFKTNQRAVCKIAQKAGISKKRAELLFRITKYFQSEHILEIGTSLGLATSALSAGNKVAKITSLEGCENTSAVAEKNLKHFELNNIENIVTEFSAYLKNSKSEATIYDLIYFDGNHQKQATLDYLEFLLPTITNETVWIFDDIHWSTEMTQAWELIKKHPKVTVTIDTFQWGFVFFRREQPKEHFIIRI